MKQLKLILFICGMSIIGLQYSIAQVSISGNENSFEFEKDFKDDKSKKNFNIELSIQIADTLEKPVTLLISKGTSNIGDLSLETTKWTIDTTLIDTTIKKSISFYVKNDKSEKKSYSSLIEIKEDTSKTKVFNGGKGKSAIVSVIIKDGDKDANFKPDPNQRYRLSIGSSIDFNDSYNLENITTKINVFEPDLIGRTKPKYKYEKDTTGAIKKDANGFKVIAKDRDGNNIVKRPVKGIFGIGAEILSQSFVTIDSSESPNTITQYDASSILSIGSDSIGITKTTYDRTTKVNVHNIAFKLDLLFKLNSGNKNLDKTRTFEMFMVPSLEYSINRYTEKYDYESTGTSIEMFATDSVGMLADNSAKLKSSNSTVSSHYLYSTIGLLFHIKGKNDNVELIMKPYCGLAVNKDSYFNKSGDNFSFTYGGKFEIVENKLGLSFGGEVRIDPVNYRLYNLHIGKYFNLGKLFNPAKSK